MVAQYMSSEPLISPKKVKVFTGVDSDIIMYSKSAALR